MSSHENLFQPVPGAPPAASGFVLCEFDGIALGIPQSDVMTIEHGSDLAAPLPGEKSLGWFDSAQGPWPVTGFDRDLNLLSDIPDARPFLVFLKCKTAPIGLVFESVRIVSSRAELSASDLPPIMRDAHHPVRSIARLPDRRLVLLAGEGLLADHVHRLSDAMPTGTA